MSTPAKRVIEKCGGGDFKKGVAVVAEMLGVHVSNVHRWTYPKSKKGGTGGIIPAQQAQMLLVRARERGIDLQPEDFFDLTDQREAETQEAAA